jgi:dihydrolipoamide dehydrogenase
MEDEDIALYVQRMLEKKGVVVHHEASLFDLQAWEDDSGSAVNCSAAAAAASTSETSLPGGVQYTIQHNRTRKMESFEVEKALVSIGRVSNYKGLGLENLKCRVQDGKLKVDDFQRAVPHEHIYAIGDATMDIALVNMGETEARLAIDHMYSYKQERSTHIDNLSTIMFLDEEVAAVGLNEQQCQKENISYMMARYGYEFVSRAVAMGDTKGFIKIIVTNDRQKRVLGVRAVGPHASSVVELASLAIHNQESAYELAELMTAYPAITQGFQECLRMLLGRSILKPNVFPQLVLKTWIPPNFERGRSYQREVGKQKSREAEQARVKIDTEKLIKEQVAEATKQAVAEQVNATTPNRQAGAATPSPLSA